ncbi:hypothetical protein QCD60_02850 [Pokkaliibacter sp. MBI-7]|uniref:Uncharacterized protein n=1 Tax=Proteobacteria bacterium 228 TaxID=2083153 RepID=A0A2S5KMG7_9PROT|nr:MULTISPECIES: hypothetical protein [Pokkaliibacter]MDH2431497.1 hypothetical protein [Pokkaliibacter sp. MBI-7]PPC75729.1 hypothetical protein C4K68_19040 [Pokkaliibacter plantistimulans]
MVELLLVFFVGGMLSLAFTLGIFSTVSVSLVGICLTMLLTAVALCLFMERFYYYRLNKIKEELALD